MNKEDKSADICLLLRGWVVIRTQHSVSCTPTEQDLEKQRLGLGLEEWWRWLWVHRAAREGTAGDTVRGWVEGGLLHCPSRDSQPAVFPLRKRKGLQILTWKDGRKQLATVGEKFYHSDHSNRNISKTHSYVWSPLNISKLYPGIRSEHIVEAAFPGKVPL